MPVVQAFTPNQHADVHRLLAAMARLLRTLPRGHFEEYHWSSIYRTAKNVPSGAEGDWSNLALNDLLHDGFGVEWKLLQRARPFADQGKSLMHPAATRRLTFDPTSDAEEAKEQILTQWAAEIEGFRERTKSTSKSGEADIRLGVLLWGSDLSQFLYFEEEMEPPNPDDFRAEWVDRQARGSATRNLYIFEKSTGQKRYSVTSPSKGAKLQPYFDIPTEDQGAHLFEVDREDLWPLWVKKDVFEIIAELDPSNQDSIIRRLLDQARKRGELPPG